VLKSMSETPEMISMLQKAAKGTEKERENAIFTSFYQEKTTTLKA